VVQGVANAPIVKKQKEAGVFTSRLGSLDRFEVQRAGLAVLVRADII
jgi:hypothetical protein